MQNRLTTSRRPRKKRYTLAFLAGDGIGPELTAEASRALQEVSRLHGFTIDEVHPPFGGEAVARYGHRLPDATRAAYRDTDAVLVATTRDPALEGVKADLDLTWRVQRVEHEPGGDLAIVSPLVDDAEQLAVERAIGLATARRGRVTSVGDGPAWHSLVEASAERFPGLDVDHLPLERAIPELAQQPEGFCVVVTQRAFAEAISDMAAFMSGSTRVAVASGRLSETGPGVFGPTHGSAASIAGQGVANPSGILLAAALLLSEGLGERAAARTLERAISGTYASGIRTPDHVGHAVGATTRSFVDAIIELMPSARTDVEFYAEARK